MGESNAARMKEIELTNHTVKGGVTIHSPLR